jgi:hypothetical protein
MCAGKFLDITSSPLGSWTVYSRTNIVSLIYPATKMIYRIQTTCFGRLLRILWVWISWVIILLVMVVNCCFLLHFLCVKSLEEIVDPVNTLGTRYLNCLYAYKRKSASSVLNVLKTTVSVSHTWMLGRPKARQFIISIGGLSTKLSYLWEMCGSWK